MRTFQRICIEDYTITARNGDSMSVKRGEEYITTADPDDHGEVTVFGPFWAKFPVRLFAGERVFTKS